MAMEQAEQTPDTSARLFLQTAVIVGAGPSGSAMADAISELMRWALNNAFKQLDPNKTRIVLVDPGERVLRAMLAQQSDAALAALHSDGIEFIAKSSVKTIRPGEVIIGTPDGDLRIEAAKVIWTAGVLPPIWAANSRKPPIAFSTRQGVSWCDTTSRSLSIPKSV